MKSNDKYFEEPYASEFDRKRELKRARDRQRLVYDCYCARVDEETGLWVYCSKGHPLERRRKDGKVSLSQALAGYATEVCQECPNYEGD